jgi:hypothetical protein
MLQSVLHFLSSVVFGITSVFGGTSGIEQPPYEVIQRIGDRIEIRRYKERIAAETTVDTGASDNARREAFRRIAGYIFGANVGRRTIDMTAPVEINATGARIAMTAPVEVKAGDQALMMRFFMPAAYARAELSEPSDSRVRLVEMPAATAAVLRFSGSTDDGAVSARAAALMNALQATEWKVAGPPSALFYNPPWTLPFLRTNEVVLPVAK